MTQIKYCHAVLMDTESKSCCRHKFNM